jgi:hypothetical protein
LKRGTSIAHRIPSFSGFLLPRCSVHDPVVADYYRNEHLIKVKYPHEAYGEKLKRKEKLL